MGASLLPPLVGELRGQISDFKAKMGEARSEVEKTEGEGKSRFGSLGTAGALAFGGLAAGAIGFAGSAVKSAIEGEKAHAQLVQAIQNSGANVDELEGAATKATKGMAKFGITNDDAEAALSRLVMTSNDASGSVKNLGLVVDLSKARHMGLEQAATLVGKAMEGNVGGLKKLGIETKDASGKTIDAAEALKLLGDRFGGSASAQAGTFEGRMGAMHATFANFREEIGERLLPILAKGMEIIAGLVDWFEKHRTVAIALGVVIGGVLVASFVAWAVAAATAAIATLAAAAPILAIVAAVALVGAAIYELSKHWRDIWSFVRDHLVGVWNIMSNTVFLPLKLEIKTIVGVVQWLRDNWSTIWSDVRGIVTAAWGVIKPIFDGFAVPIQKVVQIFRDLFHGDFRKVFDEAIDFVRNVPQRFADALGALRNLVTGVFFGMWDGIKGAWNWIADRLTIRLPDHLGPIPIPGALGGGATVSLLPHLASGGTTTRSGFAIVGEHGPEPVFLPGGAQVFPNGSMAGLGGNVTHVHFEDGAIRVLDARTAGQVIVDAIEGWRRSGGRATWMQSTSPVH